MTKRDRDNSDDEISEDENNNELVNENVSDINNVLDNWHP